MRISWPGFPAAARAKPALAKVSKPGLAMGSKPSLKTGKALLLCLCLLLKMDTVLRKDLATFAARELFHTEIVYTAY